MKLMIGEARSRLQEIPILGSLFDRSDVMSRNEKEDNHGIIYMSRDLLHISSSAVFKEKYVMTPNNLLYLMVVG
jgi:hypothetical protein